jgi:peptidoglycan/LPS O-acetylase OafA/YrhL
LHNGKRIIPEIQFLRAIAVLAVLLFHMFPGIVKGGYVGVDVFFILSGFLMTRTLYSDIETGGTVNVGRFYFKRAKRILPAALSVLVATGVASYYLLPFTLWDAVRGELVSSALWFQNWELIAKSLDYLASEEAHSPVMHYWSLSVEEQFYIIYPLFFWILVRSYRHKIQAKEITLALSIMCFGSFLYSIYYSYTSPVAAYFNTFTRIWELLLGGLAFFISRRFFFARTTARLMVILGGLGVASSIFLFSAKTVFPGWLALIPTVSSVLILLGGANCAGFLHALLSNRPALAVGDLSYAIYLWHWPLIIFYRQHISESFSVIHGLLFCSVVFALSYATKVLIEDPFRRLSFARHSTRFARSFAVLLIIFTVSAYTAKSHRNTTTETSQISATGALESVNFAGYKPHDNFIPPLSTAKKTRPKVYSDNVHLGFSDIAPHVGSYGDTKSNDTVFLIGDSHAAQWLPALDFLGKKHHVKILVTTKSACLFDTNNPVTHQGREYTECFEWSKKVYDMIISTRPKGVIFSSSLFYYADTLKDDFAGSDTEWRNQSAKLFSASIRSTFQTIERAGIQTLIIADTPRTKVNSIDCLARTNDPAQCSFPKYYNYHSEYDFLYSASSADDNISYVDFRDQICPSDDCQPVLGNILIFRDTHHLTVEYAESLSPFLENDFLRLAGR